MKVESNIIAWQEPDSQQTAPSSAGAVIIVLVTAPVEWPTIPSMVAAAAARFAERPALRHGEETLSYSQLNDAARRYAAALVASGVEPGDRVALWCPNGARWVVGALGVLTAGAVLVPVNTRFKGAEAADLLGRSGARALLTVTDFLGTDYVAMLEASGAVLPALETIVVADGPVRGDAQSWEDFVKAAGHAWWGRPRWTGVKRGTRSRRRLRTSCSASGTTGVPKGVVMTHGRTLRVATDWVAMTGLSAGDPYLMVNPYFHMFGLKAGILACVAAGATMLPEPTFDVDRVLSRVTAERVTVLPGPPTLYQSILDHPDRGAHDLTSLRVGVTGAADIPVALIHRMQTELPFSIIVTGYGLTEAGTVCSTSEGDDAEAIATTVGRPRPGFEVRIVGDGGVGADPGQSGEVMVRGRSVMAGYLDDPSATAAVLSPEGWLATGDLGLLDEEGRLHIVGRVKDMFIVGGFNAYPAEIENMLLRHPAVHQAAVIGIPDERLGEVGMAFVVVSDEVDPGELVEWSRGNMGELQGAEDRRDRRGAPGEYHRQGGQGRAPSRRGRRPPSAGLAVMTDNGASGLSSLSDCCGWWNSGSGWPRWRSAGGLLGGLGCSR